MLPSLWPQGALRIYEPDAGGSLRYAGAASVPDTPKDQKLYVTLARAFDVFSEWRPVKTEKVDKKTIRRQVELTLHNEKAAAVTLRIVQAFGSRWKLVSAPQKPVALDANRVQWTVTIPAGGKTPFAYAVDLKY